MKWRDAVVWQEAARFHHWEWYTKRKHEATSGPPTSAVSHGRWSHLEQKASKQRARWQRGDVPHHNPEKAHNMQAIRLCITEPPARCRDRYSRQLGELPAAVADGLVPPTHLVRDKALGVVRCLLADLEHDPMTVNAMRPGKGRTPIAKSGLPTRINIGREDGSGRLPAYHVASTGASYCRSGPRFSPLWRMVDRIARELGLSTSFNHVQVCRYTAEDKLPWHNDGANGNGDHGFVGSVLSLTLEGSGFFQCGDLVEGNSTKIKSGAFWPRLAARPLSCH